MFTPYSGDYVGDSVGGIIAVVEGDTRSLDDSPYWFDSRRRSSFAVEIGSNFSC